MKHLLRLTAWCLLSSLLLVFNNCNNTSAGSTEQNQQGSYVCLPCGQDCDKIVHDKPGTCKACNMELVKSTSVAFKTISPDEICNYIATHPAVVLLDVRSKVEFEGKTDPNFGTLRNAINIPIQQLEKRLPEIDSLKNRELIVFCSHSHRSPRASYILMQHGFTNVTNMAVGMSGMKDRKCTTLQ